MNNSCAFYILSTMGKFCFLFSRSYFCIQNKEYSSQYTPYSIHAPDTEDKEKIYFLDNIWMQ